MKRFKVDNKFAVYLNHRQLIQEIYSNNNDDENYELKEELFYFQQQQQELIADTNTEDENRKRKRKHRRGVDTITNSNKNTEQEQQWCTNVLAVLRTSTETTTNVSKESLQRYWEEPRSEFPQFNGANTTPSHQTTKFGDHFYIIPPKCRFFNYDVRLMTQLPQLSASGGYDLIVLDPPWRNKYIRRLKRARQCLAYSMLSNKELQEIPLKDLTHTKSLVAIWCTNAEMHKNALVEDLLGSWHLRLVHSLKWYKLNTNGAMIGNISTTGCGKQPYEMLFLACHREAAADFGAALKEDHALFSVPSIIHSHKPPLLPWLRNELPKEPKCLEIFARYLQPDFTAIGLEVMKLMDRRLYDVRRENLI